MGQENVKVKWLGLLDDYNSVMGAGFKTPREMLKYVYYEKGSYQRTGKVFLLSGVTIAKYMKLWKIKPLPKGHRWPSPCLKAIIALGDVSMLDYKQVAKKAGCSRARACTLMKENGVEYKRLRKWRGHETTSQTH